MTELSRRDAITLALAAASAGALPQSAAADAAGTAPDSLNALAATKGMGFGSCIGGSGGRRTSSFDDPAVRAIMLRECGILVPENELKWIALRPSATTFDFAPADRILDFARDNGIRARGHTLLWHKTEWFPDWLKTYDFGPNPATEAERLLREHITTVCTRYGARIFTYDVVNETIDPETGEMRDTAFTRYLGPKVIDIAFDAARRAAPHATLVYNDYMSWGPGNAKHRAGVLKLLERLRASDVPVQVLGVQSHIGPGATDATTAFDADDVREWQRFLDEAVAMDLGLAVTEFDVGDQTMPADIAQRDAAVADLARRYLDVMASYKALAYVMAWGLVDRYSWLRERWPRADGLPKRPSLYDDSYRPKPLREAIAQTFRSAPAR
jgi:endo-1,4-beta-xylanase